KSNLLRYGRIDQGIAAQLTGWSNGDFNYDGKINVLDYAPIIDSNISTQGPAFPSAGAVGRDGGLSGVSAVPEPASLTLIGATTLSLLSRRARRRYRAGNAGPIGFSPLHVR